MKINWTRTFGKVLAIAVLLASCPLFAQYYDSPGLGAKPVTAHPQDYKPLGVRAGGFMLHPGVQLAARYTDNAFYTDRALESDVIYHLRPYVTAQSTWSRHSLNVRLAADIARYQDYGFRDYEDYFFQVSGKVDVKSRSYFSYSADYLNLHEGLNSRDSEQGFEPTRYDLYGLGVGYDHTFNRLSLGASLSWRRLDFENALSIVDGVIDNQDRDRESNNLALNASYQFSTNMSVFARYNTYTVEYDEPFDRNGYQRDGDGYQVSAGLARQITGKLDASLFASYNERSYDDPLLPSTSGWAGGASLQWRATELTTVSGSISSSIEETTLSTSSGYLRTLYMVRVDHELLRFLQVNGFAAYSDNEYQPLADAPADARANDQVLRLGLGANWFINRHLFLGASYAYEKLRTNVTEDVYRVNTFWLMLGYEY